MASKHGNKKTFRMVNGEKVVFDSLKEANRFDQLYLLAKAKKISKLVIQPEFLLMDTQRHGGITYSKVKYIADFKYVKNNITYVEDVKSDHTKKLATYRVKIKWFLSLYGKDLTFLET
jgi:hypothetical protein